MFFFFLQSMSPLESQQKRLMFKLTNTVIKFVPQQEAWVIERFGKFKRILQPVSNFSLSDMQRKHGNIQSNLS